MATYLVFTENNCRIHVNPDPVPKGAILIKNNKDLPKCPPHFWKVVDNKVVEMSRPEKMERAELHKTMQKATEKPKKFNYKDYVWHAVSFILGIGAMYLWQQLL